MEQSVAILAQAFVGSIALATHPATPCRFDGTTCAMVICKLVRIRNVSSRTFFFRHSGDLVYTPRINGSLYRGENLLIPPAFDARVENLIIPWAAFNSFFAGLVFGEVGLAEEVRCVVGVGSRECRLQDIEFIRLHRPNWEPILQSEWMPLGYSRIRDTMAEVDVELVFRDASQAPDDTCESVRIARSMRFEHHLSGASPNTILLNVFDIAEAAVPINAMFCNSWVKSLGAFHTAVEVYGKEFSFYSSRTDLDSCGIRRSNIPRRHPMHVYRQSIVMGITNLSEKQVLELILHMAGDWPCRRYDIVQHNCMHFCDELLRKLGAGPVPEWITGLHTTGAKAAELLGDPWRLFFLGSLASRRQPLALSLDAPQIEDCEKVDSPSEVLFWNNWSSLGESSRCFNPERVAEELPVLQSRDPECSNTLWSQCLCGCQPLCFSIASASKLLEVFQPWPIALALFSYHKLGF